MSIPLNDDASRVAYVVEVSQATSLAPHQADDKRYHKRFGRITAFMEDYEIRDVLKRATAPEPFISFVIPPQQFPLTIAEGGEFTTRAELRPLIGNRSNAPASWLICDIYIDADLDSIEHQFESVARGMISTVPATDVHVCKYRISANSHFPIIKETTFNLPNFKVRVPVRFVGTKETFALGYEISTPGYAGGKLFVLRWENDALSLEDAIGIPIARMP